MSKEKEIASRLLDTETNQKIALKAFEGLLEIHQIKRDVVDLEKKVDQSNSDIESLKNEHSLLDAKITERTGSIESKIDALSFQIQPVLKDSKLFQAIKTVLMMAGGLFLIWVIANLSIDELASLIIKQI